MYKKILIPIENSPTDEVILSHIPELARLCGAELLLVHVADGFMARNQERLNLVESEEMLADRQYLENKARELAATGLSVSHRLCWGEPAEKILEVLDEEKCDLVAMATHGHRLLSDIVLGTVAEKIRHRTSVPILMVRAPKE